MPFVERASQDIEEWRPGVRTRLLASAATGATSLCLFEQWSEQGRGAPTHVHPDSEEVLIVLEGEATVQLGEEVALLSTGGSAVVPAGVWHSFENTGPILLRTLAAFASSAPTVRYLARNDELFSIGEQQGPQRRLLDRTGER